MVFINDQSGRAFTHYEPNCALNQHLSKEAQSANTHAYRSYLQKNANKIREQLAACAPIDEKCEICPACNQALEYKPLGNAPTPIDMSKISTNTNPYFLNPNI